MIQLEQLEAYFERGFSMKRFIAGLMMVAFFAVASVGTNRADASDLVFKEQLPGCQVLVGYTYEWRYVAVRTGLFGCRTKCVPVCCKVPVFADVIDGGQAHGHGSQHGSIAPDIHNESGTTVRAGAK